MSASANVALDPGTATAKLAREGESEPVVTDSSAREGWRAVVSGALDAAGLVPPAEGICLAVPEAWLDASVAGATAQETLRHACEDELGIARITWVGQLAAVAALTARQRGSGRYLVCDIGASGVRTAVLEVADQTIAIVAAHGADGDGWRDFDNRVRSLPAGDGDPLPADWYRSAADQDRRAHTLLSRAASSPRYRETPVYTLTGPDGDRVLLAGQVMDCFEPTGQKIRSSAARALTGGAADVAVLTGGLGWFPLAAVVLAEVARTSPVVAEPYAAARGALLFARGTVRMARPKVPPSVSLPTHRVRDGMLEDVSLVLPWTEAFADPADGPLVLDDHDLAVDIAGRRVTVRLPGLVPGPCRVGARRGWSGSTALVVRPAAGAGSAVVVALDAADAGSR